MDVIKKDATILNTGADSDFPGTFQVILSAPTKDRDGDTLLPDEWKQPLPSQITFDMDHGMSVASTIGSGVPRIDPVSGNLVVDGTYTSLPRGQETRTLVNEGHIQTTSVAFMTEKTLKDGVTVTQRELLNGAFVAIPSNRDALVLSSKAFEKSGARNNASDAAKIQAIHDLASSLGASHDAPADGKSFADWTVEDLTGEPDENPFEEALKLFASVDQEKLPAEVKQGIALLASRKDEDAADSGATVVPASGAVDAAPVAGTVEAPVEDADSEAVLAKELGERAALLKQATQFI
jgi:hypothetical protein